MNESNNAQAQTCKKNKSAFKIQNTQSDGQFLYIMIYDKKALIESHIIRWDPSNILVDYNLRFSYCRWWSSTTFNKHVLLGGKIVKPIKHVDNW
jgi:hypothetical protein